MGKLTRVLMFLCHRQSGLIRLMMKIVRLLFVLLIIAIGGFSQSLDLLDSLKKELDTKELSDEKKVYLLLKLSYAFRNEPSKELAYGKEALRLAQKTGRKNLEAYAYQYIGDSESNLGNRLEGIEALINSANRFRELNMNKNLASTLASIGFLFSTEKDLPNSIKYNKQALNSFAEIQDSFFIASIEGNIGETYRLMNMLDSAEYYSNLALVNLNQIGNGDFVRIEQGEKTMIGNLGMIHLQQGKLDQARGELTQALAFFEQKQDPYRTSVYQSEMGKLLILEGETDEGEQLINESLEMAQAAELKDQIRDFNLQLSTFYESQHQFEQALYHFKQYKNYDDTLKNVENVRKLEQQQSHFELTKKEEEIDNLNRINKLQRVLSFILFGSAIVFLVLMGVLLQANTKVKKVNVQILEQKLLVEQREKEKALLLRELNHRVKNNLQMVASLLSLHARQLKGHPAAEALMAGKYRVEALTLIHQKLYRDDIDTKIDIKDYIEELSQNLVMNFGQQFHLELKLNSLIMKIDKAIPLGLIINELVTNSLKYGAIENEIPVLEIGINDEGQNVQIVIADNGKGLPENFDFRKSNSFGLKLVHSLVKQLGGTIDCQSDDGIHWILTLDKLKLS